MRKCLSALLAGTMALALAAPVFAETYKIQAAGGYLRRDDHGTQIRTDKDHEDSGLYGWDAGTWVNPQTKLWPDTTYYYGIILLKEDSTLVPVNYSMDSILLDDRNFKFNYKKEGGGKQILKEVSALTKLNPTSYNPDGTVAEISRKAYVKLVTGHDTTDGESHFRLIGKFTVKDNANLEAMTDLGEYLGAELEHGDVIEVDFGRFVVGNRKTTVGDKEWVAGEYAMVWDPQDADRNTLLYETEAGTLLEVRLKADTDADLLYLKLNTAWKHLEEAGLAPEQAFPKGDAVVYSFEDTNNLLSATSRADIYIHNHPDTALGGESMTDLYENGKLYVYSAVISDDAGLSLTDISGKVSVGVVDGEKALRIRDRALTNMILSTVPYRA